MQKVNIIIGRFQPITTGHIKCAEYALKHTGLKTVLCMVETPESKVDERHPFPSSLLLPMYDVLFAKSDVILDIVLVKNADIVKLSEALREKQYIIGSWTCGTDRYKAYKAMTDKYAEQAGLPDDFELLEVHRTDDDASATKLRDRLKAGDRELFYKDFPKVPIKAALKFNIFDMLREQIMKV